MLEGLFLGVIIVSLHLPDWLLSELPFHCCIPILPLVRIQPSIFWSFMLHYVDRYSQTLWITEDTFYNNSVGFQRFCCLIKLAVLKNTESGKGILYISFIEYMVWIFNRNSLPRWSKWIHAFEGFFFKRITLYYYFSSLASFVLLRLAL